MAKKDLQRAKATKNDEFYTRMVDIENELRHYTGHFKDKVVFCNCDDPRVSSFFRYFVLKFRSLGLKELITTCYKNIDADLFSQNLEDHSVYMSVKDGDIDKLIALNNGMLDFEALKYVESKPLEGNGDFRSAECVKFMERADIVVTNPPFSLFRQYMAQLFKHDKKFLVIGNKNAITYKEIFPYIKDNLLWVGCTPMSRDLLFGIPEAIATQFLQSGKNGSNYRIVDGRVYGRSASIWYTNLEHAQRHEFLTLYRRYNPEDYPEFDRFKAIDVARTEAIPEDYAGVMGVPITFLDKYCPEQFEIVAFRRTSDGSVKAFSLEDETRYCKEHGISHEKFIADFPSVMNVPGLMNNPKDTTVDGKSRYARILIRNKEPKNAN